MMRTANPALNDNTFTRHIDLTGEDRMTLMGTVHKTGALLLLLLISASMTWSMVFSPGVDGQLVVSGPVGLLTIGGAIGGLIFAMVTIFKPRWAPVTAPIYAVLEGLFIGGISAFMERIYPGIVPQAAGLTFGILFALLAAYKSGLIRGNGEFQARRGGRHRRYFCHLYRLVYPRFFWGFHSVPTRFRADRHWH